MGSEAVAAYRRVLESETADTRAPVPARIEAARALLGLRESAEAPLGLFRLAQETGAEDTERERILELLPPDLRVRKAFRPASRP